MSPPATPGKRGTCYIYCAVNGELMAFKTKAQANGCRKLDRDLGLGEGTVSPTRITLPAPLPAGRKGRTK